MKKRLLSALLALCLMLSLAPEAWAGGTTADPPTSGDCGTGVKWIFTESTGGLLIYGAGEMTAYTAVDAVPWAAHREKIRAVDINSGVMSIGSNAFAGCINMTDLTIPNSVAKIGADAFTGSGLKSISYSGSDEDWNKITGLEHIPSTVAIKKSDQESATSGTCGPGVTWMLTEDTTDPSNHKVTLTIVGKGPIVIEDGRAPWASSRDKITDIIVTDDVTAIGGGAFAVFPNLKTVLIPDSVTTIEGGAFAGITNGTTIRYTGNEDKWKAITGSGKSDITSAGITPVYNYVPIVLTFTRGEAAQGTSFERTTLKNSSFELPREADPDFTAANFVAPTYLPPGAKDPVPMKFRGWLVTIDGKEMVYPEGYPMTVAGDTTFTAWWDKPDTAGSNNTISFRHKFNDDPQLFPATDIANITYQASQKDQALMIGNPAKAGYKFLGWTTLDDRTHLTESIVVPGGKSGPRVYIANWQGESFKVLVTEADGTDFSTTGYTVSPAEQKLPVKVPVADGMTWLINAVIPSMSYDNATPESPSEAVITLPENTSGDIIIQGDFEPNDYAITWDANGGAWGDEKTKTVKNAYTYDAKDDKPLTSAIPADPIRRGYVLNKWVSSETSKPVDYKKDDTGAVTITIPKGTFGDLTLKADWGLTKYNVIWDANGGTLKDKDGNDVGKLTSQYTIESKSISQTAPTWKGYTFLGWAGTAHKESDSSDLPLESSKENKNDVPLDTEEMKLEDITLTAVWAKDIIIKFDPNGGEGEMSKVPTWVGNKHSLWDCGFTAPAGKQFKTWEVNDRKLDFEVPDPDSTAADRPMIRGSYTVDEADAVDGTITFKAVWEDIQWTITLVPNNGDEDAENVKEKVSQGKDYTLPDPADPSINFTPPVGKEFNYWQVAGFTKQFKAGDTLPQVEKDYTITAQWKDVMYTVTFDKNDPKAEETMDPVTNLTYGQTYILPECGFTYPDPEPDPSDPNAKRPKTVFLAWDIDGTEYAPGTPITIEKDVTAKAVWISEDDLSVFTITYTPNGGTGTMEPTEIRVRKNASGSVTVPLPSTCGFTFTDMEFAGWTVDSAPIEPGGAVSISGDRVAAARWKGRIVYVEGGGVTTPDSYEYRAGKYENLPIEGTPVKPGSIFTEWTCDNDQVAIFNNRLIDLPDGFSGTLTLTGHWEADEGKYLVTFDPNGGTGEMAPVAVDKAEEGKATVYPLPASTYTPPAGMAFAGWTVKGDEENKVLAVGAELTLTGPVVLVAQWKEQDIDPDAPDQTVTFDPGEGTGTMEAVTVKKGQWYDLPKCTFEAPEGKEFDCWSIDGVRQEEGRILIEGDITLTALWKDKEPEPEDPDKPWTITFDAGGGTGTMAPATVPKTEGGASYTLPACRFTAPEGKTFQAWKFDGKEYAPGASITVTGDATVTAVWKAAETKPPKPTSWKITYNLNGGYMTGSGPSSYKLSDQAQTLNVPIPYKSGYTFLGWTYSGVSKPTKSVIIRANMTGDLTVVANWQMDPGTGSGSNTSQGYYISVSATAGGEIAIPWEYASQGATVSVQARPQPGYEVGSVTVVNSQGFEVGDLKDLGGGNYSFTMPGYRVNVSATFKLQSAAAGPISRPVMNYEDVRLGDWFYDSVEYVYNRGMMSGVSATQFGPNGQATRGAIWTALAAHAGFDINGGATWYERGQYWAVNRGITDGESPSGNITREQLVTMLWRYKGSPAAFGGDLGQFSDSYAVSPYAMDAMRWAVSTGLMGGANGRLNPQASTTRAEAATILARFCQNM